MGGRKKCPKGLNWTFLWWKRTIPCVERLFLVDKDYCGIGKWWKMENCGKWEIVENGKYWRMENIGEWKILENGKYGKGKILENRKYGKEKILENRKDWKMEKWKRE